MPADAPALLRRLACTNCGQALAVYDRRSIYVNCAACGLLSDATAAAARPILTMHDPALLPPPALDLPLGSELKLGKTPYRVIGRHFFFRHRPPEATVEPREERIEEWRLLTAGGEVLRLQASGGAHWLLTPLPKAEASAAPPMGGQLRDFRRGKPVAVSDLGLLETGFVEGETRYAFLHHGDAFEFAAYEAKGLRHELRFRRGARPGRLETAEAYRVEALDAKPAAG